MASSDDGASLDYLSISQQSERSERELTYASREFFCDYGAPVLAVPPQNETETWLFVQANCHHWDCKRCGPDIARKNYGRIVSGAEEFAVDNQLFMLTVTVLGEGLSREDAEAGFGEWTNRLMTYLRRDHKSGGGTWAYVAVTERQKRGHPHLHMLTTYCPEDAALCDWWDWKKDENGNPYKDWSKRLRSERFEVLIERSGFGSQYDISPVESVGGAARYVAKYLFKDMQLTRWPSNWRRVRYSRNWKRFEGETGRAIALTSIGHWSDVLDCAAAVTYSGDDAELVRNIRDARQALGQYADFVKWIETGERNGYL